MFCFFCYFDSTSNSLFPGLSEFDRVWNGTGWWELKYVAINCTYLHFVYLLVYALSYPIISCYIISLEHCYPILCLLYYFMEVIAR